MLLVSPVWEELCTALQFTRFCHHRQVARSFDGRGDSHGDSQQLLFVDENLKMHAPQSSAHLLRQWGAKLSSWVSASNIEAEVAVAVCAMMLMVCIPTPISQTPRKATRVGFGATFVGFRFSWD